MFVQTQITPNPNSLKFLPGQTVSNSGSYEITEKNAVNNDLIRNILSINGVTGVFLGSDFISVNKEKDVNWDDIKHIVISLINEFYKSGKKFVIDKDINEAPSGGIVIFSAHGVPKSVPTLAKLKKIFFIIKIQE